LQYEPSDDVRSYRVNSDRISERLGFEPVHTMEDAVRSIAEAYGKGELTDALNNPVYYNVRRMRELDLG